MPGLRPILGAETCSLSASDGNVFFLAAGDLHAGLCPPERIEHVFVAAARHPTAAFFAVPGDLTNAGRPEQYAQLEPLIASLQMPFFGVMGNHDARAPADGTRRSLFCRALSLEDPNFRRWRPETTFLFLSSDGSVDGCRVEIERGLPLLEETLRTATGPVIVFCHAPLTRTVGGVPGRRCFLSDDPGFGLDASPEVRSLVGQASLPVVWISGHTHSPLAAERLIHTEAVGSTLMHHINVSSPFFTGRDGVTTEPVALFCFHLQDAALSVSVEDATSGESLRTEILALSRP
jgi:3',5'-cyclic AMP phosphodiesterase CpdA